jgi:hypothetical protein
LYLQSEQEHRSLDADGQSGSTHVYRFPLSSPRSRSDSGVVAASYSTLLDRTWGTEIRGTQVFEGDSISFTQNFRSEGAINDVRFAASWALRDNLIIGGAIHVFTGENRLTMSREFDDSLTFAPLRDSTNVNYFGSGYSGGVLWRPARSLTVGLSGRLGAKLKLREADFRRWRMRRRDWCRRGTRARGHRRVPVDRRLVQMAGSLESSPRPGMVV